ncbi:MAG: hypothetical protein IPL23_27610 [Saprospiraceae bacterium]|nr:hypothetical protein [Saprospiraceae bacterium]
MNLIINQKQIILLVLILSSCVTSMSPFEVSKTLPTLTTSRLLSQSQVEDAINTKKCKYLVKGRSYAAPMGLSVKEDLKNGAKGIDEWVTLDGGNSYVLNNYKWIAVDKIGSTQIHIKFNTMVCEQ